MQNINTDKLAFRQTLASIDVLLTTPLKLLKKMKRDPDLQLSNIQYIILDEADKFFDFGLKRQIK